MDIRTSSLFGVLGTAVAALLLLLAGAFTSGGPAQQHLAGHGGRSTHAAAQQHDRGQPRVLAAVEPSLVEVKVPYLFDVDNEPTIHEACSHCEVYNRWQREGHPAYNQSHVPKGLATPRYKFDGDAPCCGICQHRGKFCHEGTGAQLAGAYFRHTRFDFGAFRPEELFNRIRGRTLWLLGDSQLHQLYLATECFLRDFAVGTGGVKFARTMVLTQNVTAQERLGNFSYPFNSQPFCMQLRDSTRVCNVRLTAMEALTRGAVTFTAGFTILEALLESQGGDMRRDVALLNVGMWLNSEPNAPELVVRQSSALAAWMTARTASLPRLAWVASMAVHFATDVGYYVPGVRSCMPYHMHYKQKASKAPPGEYFDLVWQDALASIGVPLLNAWHLTAPLWNLHETHTGTVWKVAVDCLHYCHPGPYQLQVFLANRLFASEGIGN